MADTSEFAHHPSINFELIIHLLETLLLTAAGMAAARTLRGNPSLRPESMRNGSAPICPQFYFMVIFQSDILFSKAEIICCVFNL